MGQLLGQGQCLLTPPQGLRRIAQAPQRVGRIDQARTPGATLWRSARARCCRRVDEGNALLQVCPGSSVFAQVEQGLPERFVGLQTERRRASRCASRTSCSPSSRAVCNAPRSDRTAISPAAPGRAGASRPPAGTAPAPGHRSAPLLGPHGPWWPSRLAPGRFAGRALAGRAQGCPGGS